MSEKEEDCIATIQYSFGLHHTCNENERQNLYVVTQCVFLCGVNQWSFNSVRINTLLNINYWLFLLRVITKYRMQYSHVKSRYLQWNNGITKGLIFISGKVVIIAFVK